MCKSNLVYILCSSAVKDRKLVALINKATRDETPVNVRDLSPTERRRINKLMLAKIKTKPAPIPMQATKQSIDWPEALNNLLDEYEHTTLKNLAKRYGKSTTYLRNVIEKQREFRGDRVKEEHRGRGKAEFPEEMFTDRANGMTYNQLTVKYGYARQTIANAVNARGM